MRIEDVIEAVTDWAPTISDDRLSDVYLFGSSIYKEGEQFDHEKYGSDLDLLVRLASDDLTAVDRFDACRHLRDDIFRLEQRLLAPLKVTDAGKPNVSVVCATPMELLFGIHKTVLSSFFSKNAFRNVRTGTLGSFKESPHFAKSKPPGALISSIQACQACRNAFLSISANGSRKAKAHDGEDVFPKDLARRAAAVAYFLRPRSDTNEHDINEGTSFLLKLLEEKSDEQSNKIWDVLRAIIQKRVGRGRNPISPEDQLLLYELLFEFSARKLREHVNTFMSMCEIEEDTPFQSLRFELSIKTSRVNLRVVIPQEDLSASQIVAIQNAVGQLVQVAGLSELKDTKTKIGSFFLEATASIIASATFEALKRVIQDRVRHERGERKDATDTTEHLSFGGNDHLQVEAVNNLIAVLENVESAVVDVGVFVVIKVKADDGSLIMYKQLTSAQRLHLDANPTLIGNPTELLEYLTSAEEA